MLRPGQADRTGAGMVSRAAGLAGVIRGSSVGPIIALTIPLCEGRIDCRYCRRNRTDEHICLRVWAATEAWPAAAPASRGSGQEDGDGVRWTEKASGTSSWGRVLWPESSKAVWRFTALQTTAPPLAKGDSAGCSYRCPSAALRVAAKRPPWAPQSVPRQSLTDR